MLTLSTASLRLSIAPDVGAGIADFSLRGPANYFYPLLRRAAPDETNASLLGSFFMMPWVNRIRAGRFSFDGRQHAIKTNTSDGMAQHGDVRKRPWTVAAQAADSVTLDFDSRSVADINWPWTFSCRAVYTLLPALRGGALRIDLSLRNTDATPFPAGLGHHPYFMRRLWNDADALEISMPVTARYPLRDGCAVAAPTQDSLTQALQRRAPLPGRHIDACFANANPAANVATLRWPASRVTLRIEASSTLAYWILYAPHERPDDSARPSPLSSVAVEPQSHANDALNLAAAGVADTGVTSLAPGQELASRCEFHVSVD